MALTQLPCIVSVARPGSTVKALLLILVQLPFCFTALADNTTKSFTNDVIQPSCIDGLLTERATIERVTDGDTVVLADQRRVRLIGINAAELNAKNPQLKAAAQRATDKIREWLPRGEAVALSIGDEPFDRHGRVLAHVIRARDGLAVAQLLVQNGLAVQSAVAPTTRCATSFMKLEKQAKEANLGLWKIRDLMSISATELTSGKFGFKLVSGTVTSVKNRKRYTEFFLENQLQVKVRPKLAKQLSLQSLKGQTVEVRGWLGHEKNQPYLWLQHTANLSILENETRALSD